MDVIAAQARDVITPYTAAGSDDLRWVELCFRACCLARPLPCNFNCAQMGIDKTSEVPLPMFAAFGTEAEEQELMFARTKRLTQGTAILIDVSASITTINAARQLARTGKQFPQDWAIDAQGQPTRDPNVLLQQGGALLPAGGLDHGHKGYAWALLAEAFSQGLSGYGRADKPSGTSMSVFIQAIDPDAFGGRADFERQMTHLADSCRASTPAPGVDQVRLPGDRALQARCTALREGVELSRGGSSRGPSAARPECQDLKRSSAGMVVAIGQVRAERFGSSPIVIWQTEPGRKRKFSRGDKGRKREKTVAETVSTEVQSQKSPLTAGFSRRCLDMP